MIFLYNNDINNILFYLSKDKFQKYIQMNDLKIIIIVVDE